ncbi:hypothetical protein HDU93_006143 [Gonapodya sp. JEL0774]|nr:hypothetical protein HDU93_006143 [Gonapodya sp. JEL0774]
MTSIPLPLPPRLLHFALPVANLDLSLAFFQQALGFFVLRHDNFLLGGDTQFQPLKGDPAWSRTMVGYVPEGSSFSLGLKFNPTITAYRRPTTPLFKFHIHHPTLSLGVIKTQDEYIFDVKATGEPRIAGVELVVRDPVGRADLLSRLLGPSSLVHSFPSSTSVRLTFPYHLGPSRSATQPHDENAYIELIKVDSPPLSNSPTSLESANLPVNADHGDIIPRLAIAVSDVDAVHSRASWILDNRSSDSTAARFEITMLPTTLPGSQTTPMRMCKILDVDGFEWVFVGWQGFLGSLGVEVAKSE